MHAACRLVQALHWVTGVPLCKADAEQGGLSSAPGDAAFDKGPKL